MATMTAAASTSEPVTTTALVSRSTATSITPATLATSPRTADSQWPQDIPGTVNRRVLIIASRSQHALDRTRGLMDELLGARVVARRGCAGHAVAEVLVEQLHAHTLDRLADGSDLRQHVDAVRVLFDQTLQTAHLPLEAAQSGEQLLLLVVIAGGCVIHDTIIPLGGMRTNRRQTQRAATNSC